MPNKVRYLAFSKEVFEDLYSQGYSIDHIGEILGIGSKSAGNALDFYKIKRRSIKEAIKVSKRGNHGLQKWRKINRSWNVGLTKETSEGVRIGAEKGRETQIKNGKS